jgi:GNAT acetyltransferase-like protein
VWRARPRIHALPVAPAGENARGSLYAIDPLQDPRWNAFLEEHNRASVFHTVGWLDALRRTYGYEPIVYTTSPPDAELRNGIVFCRVQSWVTGRRLVSLPFSDHCEPLIDRGGDFERIFLYLQTRVASGDWKYVELRPTSGSLSLSSVQECFQPSKQYYLHTIDLQPQEDQLLRRFHKSSVQRRIRRAEREGLVYECGRSDVLLRKFYLLMLLARRRHHVPPQPAAWFRNLLASMGDALQIHLVSYRSTAVASLITLRFKNTVVYKYGASDQVYHRLGSMPFLLAKAIREAKSSGAQVFDLGRCDYDNQGLIDFKNKWASTRASLTCWRFPAPAQGLSRGDAPGLKLAKNFFGFLPTSMLKLAGQILYRHIG